MRQVKFELVGLLFMCMVAAANATVLSPALEVTGTAVPTNPEVMPGFSGYTVYLHALNAGDVISAIDVGSNPVDFPVTALNYGLFGPLHQHWRIIDGETISTPYHGSDLKDSHFLFTNDATIMGPRENNNASPGGIVSPYADDATNDWGVGDTMRAIVGVGQMHASNVPFAYLVIPDGQLVNFVGLVATQFSGTAPLLNDELSPYASSVVSFSIGVPEPACVTLLAAGLLSLQRQRRLAR